MSEEASAQGPAQYTRRPVIAWTVCTLAGLAGGIQGYLFGDQLGGALLGVVAAVNSAALCALLASGLLDMITRLLRRR
jgi:hypothetical protein